MQFVHDSSGDRVTGVRIAYIGGGSRGWAWSFMTDLAMEPAMSGDVMLYDLDTEAARANEIIGNRISALPEAAGNWKYHTAETMEEALTGADFVLISILPGTFAEMESDVHAPEALNIWQSVGDTAGPGGIIRALRTLPMLVPIAEAVRDICPNAWVINYTNPMALCVRMLYETYPEIRAFGCCHEVFNTQTLLAKAVEEILGTERPERRDIHVNVTGINHFTWFTQASWKGVDLFPLYRQFVDAHYEEGFHDPEKPWEQSTFFCAHRVKFDLFRRYGAIAAAGDRHLAEFMPGDMYLRDPETIRSWKFSLTPVSWRCRDLEERRKKSEAMVSGEMPVTLKPTGEEGVLLMKSLCGLDRVISNVNLPNMGQIPNLPPEAVVETNAVFAKDSVRPVSAGFMPDGIRDLTMPHIEIQQLVLEAVHTCDSEKVVEAFLLDPNVRAKCTVKDDVAALVHQMLEATSAYLPEGWKEEL